MKLHREGYKYVMIASAVWALLGFVLIRVVLVDWPVISLALNVVFFLLWFWVLWFFRLPNRTHTHGEEKVISPADGKVVVIEETVETEYFNDKRIQVSIFMSPLNVHVNRNPISGVVKHMKYHAGKFLVAWHPKSSTENERTTMVIGNDRTELLVRQIAGAVARRIRYYVKEGDTVKQNEEFGFIQFGSRVDVFFPLGTKIDVKIGDVVQGGVTVLAHLS